MAAIPADAPRSEDGAYWWDGSQWQLISEAAGAATGSGTPSGGTSHEVPADAPRSEDGAYWWDGSQWQPVGGQGGGSGSAPASTAAGQGGQSLPPETFHVDGSEFPAFARLVYFVQAQDVDGYLSDLGIDPSGMDTDADPANV
jgi:hypothetical protein